MRLKRKDSGTLVVVILLGAFVLGMLFASRDYKPYQPIKVTQPGNP